VHRISTIFSLFLLVACTLDAQTTRYAYTPISTNTIYSNWDGAGKQARDVFLPADTIAAATDGSVYVKMRGNGPCDSHCAVGGCHGSLPDWTRGV
jgi:hypothetical protein